jgi:hypothetical protein
MTYACVLLFQQHHSFHHVDQASSLLPSPLAPAPAPAPAPDAATSASSAACSRAISSALIPPTSKRRSVITQTVRNSRQAVAMERRPASEVPAEKHGSTKPNWLSLSLYSPFAGGGRGGRSLCIAGSTADHQASAWILDMRRWARAQAPTLPTKTPGPARGAQRVGPSS